MEAPTGKCDDGEYCHHGSLNRTVYRDCFKEALRVALSWQKQRWTPARMHSSEQ